MHKQSIAIITTVANFELYKISSKHFPEGIRKYVINGTNGMYGIDSIIYMFKKLKNKGIEWLIMADEDVIFLEANSVFKIIEKMKSGTITVAGVRDGGVIAHRARNPYVINTFFSVINLKEVMKIWNKEEVLENQFTRENEFSDDLSKLTSDYDTMSTYEPYYCFYLWLRRMGKKFLFLYASIGEDTITNLVYFEGKPILKHTWYARAYGENPKHTARIDKVINSTSLDNREPNDIAPIVFNHKNYALSKRIKAKVKSLIKKFNA